MAAREPARSQKSDGFPANRRRRRASSRTSSRAQARSRSFQRIGSANGRRRPLPRPARSTKLGPTAFTHRRSTGALRRKRISRGRHSWAAHQLIDRKRGLTARRRPRSRSFALSQKRKRSKAAPQMPRVWHDSQAMDIDRGVSSSGDAWKTSLSLGLAPSLGPIEARRLSADRACGHSSQRKIVVRAVTAAGRPR